MEIWRDKPAATSLRRFFHSFQSHGKTDRRTKRAPVRAEDRQTAFLPAGRFDANRLIMLFFTVASAKSARGMATMLRGNQRENFVLVKSRTGESGRRWRLVRRA